MTKTTTLKLKHPVQLADGALAELTMRRPTVGDQIEFEKAKGGELENEALLFSWLCGRNVEDIAALDMEDYKALQQVYTGFTKPAATR